MQTNGSVNARFAQRGILSPDGANYLEVLVEKLRFVKAIFARRETWLAIFARQANTHSSIWTPIPTRKISIYSHPTIHNHTGTHMEYRKGKEVTVTGGAPSPMPSNQEMKRMLSFFGTSGPYSNDKTKGSRWIVSAHCNRRLLTYTIM